MIFDSDGCKAIVYCSETCRQADLDQGFFTPGQSHRCTCSVMKAIMAKEMALCDFPFSFSKGLCNVHTSCMYLYSCKVYVKFMHDMHCLNYSRLW